MTKDTRIVGKSIPNRDAALKVAGQLPYVGDMKMQGMLYGEVLFSPHAHAKIISIDTSEASALPGVRAVATHENTPAVLFNSATRFYEHQIPNTERLFDTVVRHVGDRVAAVAADTREIAKQAVKLIKVTYKPLPFYLDPEEAIKEGALPLHGDSNVVSTIVQNAGDVDEAMKTADRVFEDRYTTPAIHQGAIEPHVSIAHFDASGKLTLISPNQSIFAYRIVLCRIFGLPMSQVRVTSPAIGGGFGGKLEVTTELVSAALTMLTKKPVRVEYARKDCINSTRTRHASVVYIKTGVKNDGTIVAQDLQVYTNTGAYAGSALNVLGALSHKVFKVYKCKNMRFTGKPVYTNTSVAGAMRGYGSPQAFFGQQRQLWKIAKELGIPLAELQRKNLVEPTDHDPVHNKPLGNPRPLDCLRRAQEIAAKWPPLNDEAGRYKIGTSLAIGAHGNGCFGAHRDQTCMMIKMNEDGSCVLYSGSHDMGNGSITVQTQIVAEELCLPLERIAVVAADSDAVAWNLGDYASRGVYVQGHAVKQAAEAVRTELVKEAALLLNEDPAALSLCAAGVRSNKTGKVAALDDVMLHAQNVSHREIICQETYTMAAGPTSYGVHVARVKVDAQTGQAQVTDYAAVHDVGHVLNRMSIEGQLEGGIHIGLGYALCESLKFDETGKNVNDRLGPAKYKMLSATEMPRITTDFIEENEPSGPYGAKSIGEAAVVPSAPAVLNAICEAIGEDIHDLPYREWLAQHKPQK